MPRWTKLAWLAIAVRQVYGVFDHVLSWLAMRLPERWARLITGWSRLPDFRRHLLINMIVGLVIAVLLHQLHHVRHLHRLDNMAIDWAMKLHRGTEPAGEPLPFAIIEIDEASFREWDEPLYVPRDKLATLIRHAMDGDAAVIFVDIELSKPGGEGDAALKAVLQPYTDEKAASELPQLILVRVTRPRLDEDPRGLLKVRPSILDDLVAQAPRVHWATPLFELDRDGVVRRWHLWEAVCGEDAKPQALPSVQLLTNTILHGDVDRLDRKFKTLLPDECALAPDAAHTSHQDAVELELGEGTISLVPEDIGRRIVYTMPWHLESGESRPLITLNDELVPLLEQRPANAVVAAPAGAGAEWLRDRITIIGSSYRDSRDLYQTPIGLMPGYMIAANAIQSIDSLRELRIPNLLQTIAIEAVLILILSYLFARFASFWGTLLSGLFVITILVPVSLFFFRTGYWVSFAIPLFAIQLHQLAVEFEEALERRVH